MEKHVIVSDQLTPMVIIWMIAAMVITWVGCVLLVTRWRQRVIDLPNARSAHSLATPRGGGMAIALAMAFYTCTLYWTGALTLAQTVVLLSALPVAVVGFLDDISSLPVRYRLPVHILIASLSLWVLGPVPEAFFSGWLMLPAIIQGAILVVALVWLLNLYNFMDGIDGLAAMQCLFVSLSGAFFLKDTMPGLMPICLGLAACQLCFLYWNWTPARLFMGDAGSTFCGYFLGVIGLLSHYAMGLSVWGWVLLMGSFIADTTFTLVRRLLAGHSITEGHATHAYQQLSRKSDSHIKVALLVMAVNIIWLFPIAWLAVIQPENGVFLAFSGIVPLMILAAWLGAGRTNN